MICRQMLDKAPLPGFDSWLIAFDYSTFRISLTFILEK